MKLSAPHTLFALLLVAWLLPGCPTDPAGGNGAPELRLDVPATFDYVVGEGRITITATAEDPEGGEVEIGVVDKPERAIFEQHNGWAVFDWDPLASDVTPADEPLELIFYAEDPVGTRTERVVSVLIRAGNGVPRFENSPSVLYNTDSGKPLIFEVRVRDNDSQRVAIAMPTELAPDGARYTPTGDFTGKFEWTPTEQQMEFRVHSVTFTADDGQNDTVKQKVSILFKKAGGGGAEEARPDVPDSPTDPSACPYEDRVRHTPLPAQHGSGPYLVQATLAGDAVGKYDRMVLNWTTEDAYNEDIQLEGMEMANSSGTFTASIPNALLPPGETKVYYYELCAIDDDSNADDSVLCGPSSIYHSFIAYSANDSACADDSAQNHSFSDAVDLEPIVGWDHHRACGSNSDYYRMDLQANQDADIFFTYPFDAGVTIELFDENQSPIPMEASPCSGFAYVYVENPDDAPLTRFFKVTGNDVPYQISPFYFEPLSFCAVTDLEPNDDAASASTITTDGTPTDLQEICGANDVDVFKFNVTAGQEITANSLFTHADGDLDMKLFAPSKVADVSPGGNATAYALSVSDNEEIQHVAQESGDYYILMRGYTQGNTYTLSVTATMSCTDDDTFGDNHSSATAANATAFTTHRGLKVCGGNDDWYEFEGFEGEFIDVTLKVTSGSASAVSTTILLDGASVATGMLSGDTITASVDVAMDSTFQLQVSTTQAVEYELTIDPTLL